MDYIITAFVPEGKYIKNYIREADVPEFNEIHVKDTSIKFLLKNYTSEYKYSFLFLDGYAIAIDMGEEKWFRVSYKLVSYIRRMIIFEDNFDDLLLLAGCSILNSYHQKLPVFITKDIQADILFSNLAEEEYQETEYTNGIDYIKLNQMSSEIDMDLILGFANNISVPSPFYLVATRENVKICNTKTLSGLAPGSCITIRYINEDFAYILQPLLNGICPFDDFVDR